jgi:hypothetical protein
MDGPQSLAAELEAELKQLGAVHTLLLVSQEMSLSLELLAALIAGR